MSDTNNDAPLFGVAEVTNETRIIPVSKKLKAKDPTAQPKVIAAVMPVLNSLDEAKLFVANVLDYAEAKKSGNGVLWVKHLVRRTAEGATEVALRDGNTLDEVAYQDEFVNLESGARSLTALEKAKDEAAAACIELLTPLQDGSWRTAVNDDGTPAYEDEAHFLTVVQQRQTNYARASAVYEAAAQSAAVKAEAMRVKKAAKKAAEATKPA